MKRKSKKTNNSSVRRTLKKKRPKSKFNKKLMDQPLKLEKESSSVKNVEAPTHVQYSDKTALDALIEQQQTEARKAIEDILIPQAKNAQSFYGFLTISENGGGYESEKVTSVERLEAILEGMKAGTMKVVMNPFAAAEAENSNKNGAKLEDNSLAAKKTKTTTVAVDGVSTSTTETTTYGRKKDSFFKRLFGG
jgi:hypothetical protein